MKKITVNLVPDPAVTDPNDVVTQYRFAASVGGVVVAPLATYNAGDVASFEVDPGPNGCTVDFAFSYADAAGNWITPDLTKSLAVEGEAVPDTTPPPVAANDLAVAVAVETPATPEATQPDAVLSPSADPAPAPVTPAAPTADPAVPTTAPADPAPVAPEAPAAS